MSISDLFKKTEAVLEIANKVEPCIKAFQSKNLNSKEAVDLSVTVSKKIVVDYGLNGKAIDYLKDFTTNSIKTFSKISSDVKNHDYLKAFIDFASNSKSLIADSEQIIVAIKEDVATVQEGKSKAIKEFKTDTVEAGEIYLKILSMLFAVQLKAQNMPKMNYKSLILNS